jgi:hypothetical protein
MEELRRRAISFPMYPADGTLQERESFITKFIDSLLRLRANNDAHQAFVRKNSIQKIDGLVPEFIPKVAVRCQAINMNNIPCKYKATCGKFCKKHQVSKKDLELLE